jgi:hypothetical protein
MPPRKKSSGVGGPEIVGCAILPRDLPCPRPLKWNGGSHGVRGHALSPWAHNAGAADKARGQPGSMFGVNTSCRAAIPGGVEWPGQALQGDTIPHCAGGGGGGWAGNVLVSKNISTPLFKTFKGKKCLFAIFSLKIQTSKLCP